MRRRALVGLLFAAVCSFASADDASHNPALVGQWSYIGPGVEATLILAADGTWSGTVTRPAQPAVQAAGEWSTDKDFVYWLYTKSSTEKIKVGARDKDWIIDVGADHFEIESRSGKRRTYFRVATATSVAGTTEQLPVDKGGVFGTVAPTVVHSIDPNERWMALWQARQDPKRMELYLIIGGGEGTEIDGVAAVSDDSRWLAIVRRGRLELVDANAGTALALEGARAEHRGHARFAGNRLLFVRQRPDGDALVIFDLATHSGKEIALRGEIQWIRWARDGLVGLRGVWLDRPESFHRTFDLNTGTELDNEPEIMAIIGTTLVRYDGKFSEHSGLYFDSDRVFRPDCHPNIAAVMQAPPRVVVTCASTYRVFIVGRDGVIVDFGQPEEVDYDFARFSEEQEDPPRVLPSQAPPPQVICTLGHYCIFPASNRRVDLKGGIAQAVWGNKVYVYDFAWPRAQVLDVSTMQRVPVDGFEARLSAGKYVVDTVDRLIDVEAAKTVGRVWDAGALNSRGRVVRFVHRDELKRWFLHAPFDAITAEQSKLLATAGDRSQIDRGPLRWTGPSTGEQARREAAQRTRDARIRHLEQITVDPGGGMYGGGSRLTIYGDGEVELWSSGDHNPLKGVRTRKISAQQLRRLTRELERMDFFRLQQSRGVDCPDAGNSLLSVRADGRFKSFFQFSCLKVPQWLSYFEDLIHRVVGTEEWINAAMRESHSRSGEVIQVPADFERKHSKLDAVRLYQEAASSGNCAAAKRLIEIYAAGGLPDHVCEDDDWYQAAQKRGCTLPALKQLSYGRWC